MRNVTVTLTSTDGSKMVISGFYSNRSKPTEEYFFSPGDKVRIAPPNPNNKKHRNRVGVLTSIITKNHKIYVDFDDGGFGAVEVVSLIPES
jgi:hypothetical protein